MIYCWKNNRLIYEQWDLLGWLYSVRVNTTRIISSTSQKTVDFILTLVRILNPVQHSKLLLALASTVVLGFGPRRDTWSNLCSFLDRTYVRQWGLLSLSLSLSPSLSLSHTNNSGGCNSWSGRCSHVSGSYSVHYFFLRFEGGRPLHTLHILICKNSLDILTTCFTKSSPKVFQKISIYIPQPSIRGP
jgi:hypothetical protein